MQTTMFVILFVVLVFGCTLGLWNWWQGRQKPINSALSSNAKIADRREVNTLPEKKNAIPENGILLGRVIGVDGRTGGRFASTEETSAIVIGPTGSGKTSQVLIPAVLRHKGPLLSTTTKDEIARMTFVARESLDPLTVIFDPAGVVTDDSLTRSRKVWTPLQAAKTFDEAAATSVIIMKTGTTSREGNSPWQSSAISLLTILLWVTAQFPKTSMDDLIKLMGTLRPNKLTTSSEFPDEEEDEREYCNGYATFEELVSFCTRHPDSGWQALAEWLEWGIKESQKSYLEDHKASFVHNKVRLNSLDADRILGCLVVLRSVADGASETSAGVIFTLNSALREICTSVEVSSAAWDDTCKLIDLSAWANSRAGSIHIVAPDAAEPYRSLFSAFIADSIKALDAKAVTSRDARLPRQALLVLDELPNICPVPQLGNWLATKRSQNIRFVLGAQNLSQIEARWGKEEAASIVDSCPSFQLLLPGSTDHKTTEHFAKYAGEYLHRIDQTSIAKSNSTTKPRGSKGDKSDTNGKTVTTSEQTLFRPLAQDYALRELRRGEAVALILGHSFARLQLTRWDEDPELKRIQSDGYRNKPAAKSTSGGERLADLHKKNLPNSEVWDFWEVSGN